MGSLREGEGDKVVWQVSEISKVVVIERRKASLQKAGGLLFYVSLFTYCAFALERRKSVGVTPKLRLNMRWK